MAKPKIAQKSPYILDIKPGKYWWCACGLSTNQPFCDGSHKDTEFTPMEIDITEEKTVAWCGCKHSSNGCFCDGTHKDL
ncbi:MAG: CDGSH iron-sulfur domain-containing protein [Ignavibacteria bacterium]|nr:CDGSH iron-sulfur domain-containing protein [Ignavibacteria bacterium]